ncbi:LysM peptidoglycan-binding domain-containing protein [Acetohalobium arabaticum]|uniref:Peptidoglycan-binding lysin domain protein n=1 Tax=Acetohalobium arabaticum (strain ATCC 49924 / DSM 5501 / Z-7288) TaxID=574087 RepID=D9QUR4_ACEAZ|nr:LysM domain-containing protein [Acetohalobium arabaticum]ADL11973.1 Peptidoglycan-binding lysin domain protein [Acetohalobium arabaticum DSM 5501]
MDGIFLAREIRNRERELNSLYKRLDQQVTDGNLQNLVNQLRQHQSQQLSQLDELIKGLEGPRPFPPTVRLARHVVQQGETLSQIASQYNTTVANLLRVNPDIDDPDMIQAGKTIRLPIILPPSPECYFEYEVKRGDTLFKLTQQFNTTVNELVYYNSIKDPDLIYPGQILIIPCPEDETSDDDKEISEELTFNTLDRSNANNYSGSIEEKLFAASTRAQLRRALNNFNIRVPTRVNFNTDIVIGAIEYDIENLYLEDRRIRVVVDRKARGYHLVTVPRDQFREQGSYRVYFVTRDNRTLDRDRVNI